MNQPIRNYIVSWNSKILMISKIYSKCYETKIVFLVMYFLDKKNIKMTDRKKNIFLSLQIQNVAKQKNICLFIFSKYYKL